MLTPADISNLQSCIGAVLINRLDGQIRVYGTVFLIYVNKRTALGVTAAHVAREIEGLSNSYVQSALGSPFSYELPQNREIRNARISGFFKSSDHRSNQEFILSTANKITFNSAHDIAFLHLVVDDHCDAEFGPQLGIDLRHVAAGQRFLVCGYPETSHEDVLSEENRTNVNLNFCCLWGEIIETEEIIRLSSFPAFSTSLSFPSGVSGGPIIRFNSDGGASVIGVASHSTSFGGNDTGTICPIWLALLMKVPTLSAEHNETINLPLFQVLREGRAAIRVEGSLDSIQKRGESEFSWDPAV